MTPMPEGHNSTERRKFLLRYLLEHGKIAVNNKWQLLTKQDPVLKKLLRRGVIAIERGPTTGRKSPRKRQSYIVLRA